MDFDLRALTSSDNPYPVYTELREKEPVCWSPKHEVWALSRWQDVHAALMDPGTYSSAEGIMPNGFVGEVPMLLTIDPPRHDAVRKTVQRAFAPSRLRSLEPSVRQVVRSSVDRLLADGGGDLYHGLAVPIPVAVVSLLLGVEVEDQEQFVHCCDAIVTGLDGTGDEALEAQRELLGYFDRIFPERRKNPGGDLVSALLPEVDAGALTEGELLGLCFLILVAGTETTTNALSSSLILLNEHRDLRQTLVEQPQAIRRAVEEFLRYETPVQGLSRTLTRDVVLHDQHIRAGERVHLLFGSANRDEAVFEQASQLDITRDPNPHLGFGFGIHFCLGAFLARMELRVALEEWLGSCPDYEVDPSGVERLQSFTNRGYCHVPVSTL
jgi:cytochrome P450